MEKLTTIELAAELHSLQRVKNDGRGVSCVRDVIAFLDRQEPKMAAIICCNEWYEIRNYKDIKDCLVENLLGKEPGVGD